MRAVSWTLDTSAWHCAMSKTELCDMARRDAPDPEVLSPNEPRRATAAFERYLQPCLAELLGSALFIFVGCCSVVQNSATTGLLQPALAHGLALIVVIAVLGEISGGHFNPAVSLCVYFVGGLRVVLLLPYVVSQLLGGMIGAALARAITTPQSYASSSGGAFNVVQNDSQVGQATVAEIVMTAFLTMTVCMGAVNGKSRSALAPLCIGLTVAADILAGGSVSGACMNPARAFGPALVANCWGYHWIYWVGPLGGAFFTACVVRLLMGDRSLRLILK
ncbi:aquaporin-8-like [Brienomyrus brachyistius]|uniref:aquaporin-8-like n=1 Tax=Brienomyrus brachyistius TaxID=42636 RepID=UPI0020B18A92|nr:aquaporin-8-like [Brienomyrus brachyistius]